MDLEKRLGLIKQVGEEILTEEELRSLLETKTHPIAYDGFEPSGKLHIAQGIMRAINVNKMLSVGVHFKMWVADWFGWMNNKMGGDLEKIHTVGKYQIEVWKACGMKTKEIEFLWTSEVIAKNPEYWKRTMNIARSNSVARIIRCAQIMGRSETENLSAAQIFYPCMQASDIFELKADITQLGMDQRKVNILARETGPKLGLWKPVVVSHHMLMGLIRSQYAADKVQSVIKKFNQIFEKIDEISEKHVTLLSYESSSSNIAKIAKERLKELKIFREWLNKIDKISGGLSDKSAANLEKISYLYDTLEKCFDNVLNLLELLRNRVKEIKDYNDLHDVPIVTEAAILGDLESTFGFIKEKVKEFELTLKMSKSIPDSAIFMDDSTDEIKRKISKAFCPEKIIEENPILEYCRYLIFEKFKTFKIERPQKFGGSLELASFDELAKIYSEGKLHPTDLKNAVAIYIDKMISPVRKHFSSGSAKKLLEQVRGFEVTR